MYLPSPFGRAAGGRVSTPSTEEMELRHPDEDGPLAALAFKVATDPYVGQASVFLRVYSGRVKAGGPQSRTSPARGGSAWGACS